MAKKPEWRVRMTAALQAGGCETTTEWSEKNAGQHCWFVFRNEHVESCILCGVVRRADGQNKPCNGLARVQPR